EPEEKKKQPEPGKKAAPVAPAVDRGEPESPTPATARALSPSVRHIVEEEKLKPDTIRGTGIGGRLTKADVLEAARARETVGEAVSFLGTAAPSPAAVQPSPDGRFTRKKMSPLRRKIAQQLVMAQHTAAILTTF